MARRKKPWERDRKQFRRITKKLSIRKRILIVCEGEKTEPNYFKSFRVTSANIEIDGTGRNTDSLVEYAKELYDKAKNNHEDYDEVWCVFDKNSFPDRNFNNAVSIAEKMDFRVAYSNEAFELWYLLHFIYNQSALKREDYISKLEKHINHTYQKYSTSMYEELIEKQNLAIKNATKLHNFHSSKKPSEANPSATVYLLVKELNKYKS